MRRLACALVAALMLALPAGPAGAELVGAISGVVTADGRPVANAWVSIIPVTPTGFWAGRGVVVATDEQGRYRVADVYTDFVKIQVRGPAGLATTYWPDAHTFGEARALRVTGSGTRADVALAAGRTVRGAVVDHVTGQPVVGAVVTALASSGSDLERVGSAGPWNATEPGSFTLADVPPVPVVLWVQPPPGSRYLHQWYDDAAAVGGARWIEAGPAAAGLRVRLREGAVLSGTVRDDTGAPVPGAEVSVLGCRGLCPRHAVTDADGGYRFDAVVPGRGMRVRADAQAGGYLGGWYRESAGEGEARIDLAAGQSREGVDVVLTRGALLVVEVLDDRTGAPLAGVSAELQSLDSPNVGYPSHSADDVQAPGSAAYVPPPDAPAGLPLDPSAAPQGTAGDGADPLAATPDALLFGPVPPGSYRLTLYPGTGNSAFLPVTWGAASGVADDGRISLDPGQRAQATVRLVPACPDPSPESPGPGRSCQPQPGQQPPSAGPPSGWPGLSAAFLGPLPSWAS